jgi:hypothetical protein
MAGEGPAVALVRADTSRLAVTVTLGGAVHAYVDDGEHPVLVIDTGHGEVLIEPSTVDADAPGAFTALAAAAARVAALVSGRRPPVVPG